MPTEQREERRVMLLKERYEQDLDKLIEWAKTPGGRPMFHMMLTKDEQLERWLNPNTKVVTEEAILKQQGPEGLRKYRERMLEMQYGV
jgi:hypothetical protein